MDVPPDETEDAETKDAVFECALTELLAEGIATDVRPLLKKFQKAPAAVAEAFALLPPSVHHFFSFCRRRAISRELVGIRAQRQRWRVASMLRR